METLKKFIINLKSLDQDILDPIILGAGDANGRTLSVILSQEAAARMTPNTNLYLSWKHNDTKIEGLNVFTKVNNDPNIWEIYYPQSMLIEGNVLACIKFIDEISISTTTNFNIKILADPNSDEYLLSNDNYSIFKKAAIDVNNLNTLLQKRLDYMNECITLIEEKMKELNIKEEETQGE